MLRFARVRVEWKASVLAVVVCTEVAGSAVGTLLVAVLSVDLAASVSMNSAVAGTVVAGTELDRCTDRLQ